MKKLIKLLKNEEGQAVILAALVIVILIGFTAFVVDAGTMYVTKSKLQNAADAAALAGAQELPIKSAATGKAEKNAEQNGVEINTPNYPDSTQIEVVSKGSVFFTFAKVLGFTQKEITAKAVAKKILPAGKVLPFINLDDDYTKDPEIVAWEKTGPGDFESLWKDDFYTVNGDKKDDHSLTYFAVDYADGITVTEGEVADIKDEVGYVYDQHKTQYIFSLRSDVIESGKYSTIKNKDVISLEDLVLLKVSFDSYDPTGKALSLTVIGEYDIAHLPADFSIDGTKIYCRLIE